MAKSEELNLKQKAIIPVAAFTASGDIEKLKPALVKGLETGLTVNELKEVQIQMYAYAGFPRSLNGLNAFLDVLNKREAEGKKDVQGMDATPLPAGWDSKTFGDKTRNELVQKNLTNNPAGYAQFAPIVDDYLKAHLFGDIFARDVLNHQDRELATISALSAMDGTEAQLSAHYQLSMNTGLSREQLKDFISALQESVGDDAARRAQSVFEKTVGPNAGMITKSATIELKQHVKGKATLAGQDHFTGKVFVDSNFSSKEQNGYFGAMVSFMPGSRTAWHSHPLGQTLVVISGKGLVQKEGTPAQEILPGDVVWIPSHVKHWHGATPDSPMSHIAIVQEKNGSATTWMEKVSDNQYKQQTP